MRIPFAREGRRRVTTVLVVEDDPAILRGLTDNLRYEGYQVLQAQRRRHRPGSHLTGKPDLIVLDLMLPRTSGLEVCRRAARGRDHDADPDADGAQRRVDRVLGPGPGRGRLRHQAVLGARADGARAGAAAPHAASVALPTRSTSTTWSSTSAATSARQGGRRDGAQGIRDAAAVGRPRRARW